MNKPTFDPAQWRTQLKATLYTDPNDDGGEIDLEDEDTIQDDYFALDIDGAHYEGAMQGAGECLGTHADSIELVDSEDGKYALYRHLYRDERLTMRQTTLERHMYDTYGVFAEYYGVFLLVERAETE